MCVGITRLRQAFIVSLLVFHAQHSTAAEWKTIESDEWKGAIVCKDDETNHSCLAMRCGTVRGAEITYFFSGGDIEIGREVPVRVDENYSDILEVTSGDPTAELNFALDAERFHAFIEALREGNAVTVTFDAPVVMSLKSSSRSLGQALKICATDIAALPEAKSTETSPVTARAKVNSPPIPLTPAALQMVRYELRRRGFAPDTGQNPGLLDDELRTAIASWQESGSIAATGELTRAQAELLFDVRDVEPADSGSAKVPFIVLESTTLGSVGTLRNSFQDPRLRTVDFSQCMALCAGDERCDTVEFTHGCGLGSGISYRHDGTGDYSDGAVVLSRADEEPTQGHYTSARLATVLDKAIDSYVPSNARADEPETIDFDMPRDTGKLVTLAQLTIREKLRPEALEPEHLIYGDLGTVRGRSKPFWLRDWVVISPEHGAVIDAYEELIREGGYSQPDQRSKAIIPKLQAALAKAETQFGADHPVLGFLLMDMAELGSQYTTQLVPSEQAQTLRRELMRRAARLLQGAENADPSMQALLAEHAIIASIETIHIDSLSTSDQDDLETAVTRADTQWGRCHADDDEDRHRSDAILASIARHRQAVGYDRRHLGWIKRATNCLDDQGRILQLLGYRVSLARAFGDSYALAATLADLGHARFNSGNNDGARRAFAESVAIFHERVMEEKSHLDFIHTVYTNSISEDAEYYSQASGQKREVWESFTAVDLEREQALVLALEYRSMVEENRLTGWVKDHHMAYFGRLLLAAGLPEITNAVFMHFDHLVRGSGAPSPVIGMLDIADNGIQTEDPSFKTRLLTYAKKLADARTIPDEQARAAAILASDLDQRGELEAAAEAARDALLTIKENDLDASHFGLEGLELLISKASREQGEVELLVHELATTLNQALDLVCRGEQDLTAFPWLPIDQLIDDPLLSEAFLQQRVVTTWLDCFHDHRHKLAFKDWSGGHLPADLLTDALFALARLNRRSEVSIYLDQLVQDASWNDDRGYGARMVAISAAIDGLVLAGRADWFEPYEAQLLPSLAHLHEPTDGLGNRRIDAMTRLGYSAHSLGNWQLVDEIATTLRKAAREFAAGPYSNGKSCGSSCEFLLFYEALIGNSEAAAAAHEGMLGSINYYTPDETFESRRKRRNGVLAAWLHEKAGRLDMAELYISALYLEAGMTRSALQLSDRPLDRADNIRFATLTARIDRQRGDIQNARSIALHFLKAVQQRTKQATILGTDPLVRWSERLKGLFELFLETAPFPRTRSHSDAVDDLFFASQFLQTTNTASTFAKLSARIGVGKGGDDIRSLQDVAAELDTAYTKLVTSEGEEATRTAERIAGLEQRRQSLTERIARDFPAALGFAGLQFPGLDGIQEVLGPDEAVLSTVVSTNAVHLWLIRHDRIKAVRLAERPEKLAAMIEQVRKVSNAQSIGLPIDAAILHEVYKSLFGQLETDLDSIDNLIFIPHKMFDGLPLNILLTGAPPSDKIPLRQIRELNLPWLVRRYAVSIMPSVAAVRYLKGRSDDMESPRDPFFGIGNPLFDEPLRLEDGEPGTSQHRGGFMVDTLPETEVELSRLASILGASRERDLLLGAAASEEAIKARNLSTYNIIAFATHGMIANELPGIREPSLLLSVPSATNMKEDGILYASEIAGLKLNADLVILSACNTAAGNGKPGAEGLSGLANAFFFAGARQLVVTHWYIPSAPAVEISVGMVEARQQDPALDWPQALRHSLLELIDNKGEDYNAHPLMWGAHMLVGVPR